MPQNTVMPDNPWQALPGNWDGIGAPMPWGFDSPPWGSVPEKRATEYQAWMNATLPWLQQQMAARQFWAQLRQRRGEQETQAGLQREGWAEQMRRLQEQLGYERWAQEGSWDAALEQIRERARAQQRLARVQGDEQMELQELRGSQSMQELTRRLQQEKQLAKYNRELQREMSQMQTFGRRWKPNSRWM